VFYLFYLQAYFIAFYIFGTIFLNVFSAVMLGVGYAAQLESFVAINAFVFILVLILWNHFLIGFSVLLGATFKSGRV
jgi:hypothetical protein